MTERVDEHKDIVRSDAEDQSNDQNVKVVEQIYHEHATVEEGAYRQRQDDLIHGDACQESGAKVQQNEPENDHHRDQMLERSHPKSCWRTRLTRMQV